MRKTILNHILNPFSSRYIQEENELYSCWYTCEICNLDIFWSSGSFRNKINPWKILTLENKVLDLNINCEEQQIKNLLE